VSSRRRARGPRGPGPATVARLRRIAPYLDALVASHDRERALAADPLGFVHQAAPEDREVVALLAALLAFGNVKAVRASVARVLARLGPSPSATPAAASEAELAARLADVVHRVYRGADLARVLARAAAVRAAHGSLGALFARELALRGDLREALAAFADALRGPAPGRGLAHLVPDPRKGSASKRLLLLLRWMARPADGVDLGLWPVPASALLIPVDTHVQRIARNLGLTRRRDASWRTAEEITAALRVLRHDDPVRYDFALCHLGVSRDCPSRRDDARCARCAVRPICRQWTRLDGAPRAVAPSACASPGAAVAGAPPPAAYPSATSPSGRSPKSPATARAHPRRRRPGGG
jgi:uncharacterized protein (TIGR02757 family)